MSDPLDMRTIRSVTIRKIKEHRESPSLFAKEALDMRPTPQQEELFSAIAKPGAHVAVRSGHGTGKSTALAVLALWFLCTHDDAKAPCTAPTGHQMDDILWPEVMKWHSQLHPFYAQNIRVTSEKIIVLNSPSFAVKRTGRKENPEALQGFHATNLLFLIDEASGIPEQIFEVAEGALSTPDARVLMTGNPTRTTGYFHRAFHRDRDMWVRLHFSSEDSPRVAKKYVTDMEKKYGRDSDIFRVRVLGDFPSASVVQLIPTDIVEQALGKQLTADQYQHAPKVLGVDVAWYGDDRSAVFLRQGLRSQLLGQWRGVDNMTLAGLVAQFEEEHQTDATFIDVGWGTGVIDRLRQLGHSPVPVNFGGKAKKANRYFNLRAEIWCEMKEWLEAGGILPSIDDLKDDLVAPEYGFTSTGKIQLESKEDIKKRGLASPDLADALALTFTAPVMPKSHNPVPQAQNERYNPLNRHRRNRR